MTAFLIALPILMLLGAAVQRAFAASDVQGTRRKFAQLGTIAGRSKADIIQAVGQPTSVSNIAGGKTLLQWQHVTQAGAYHIALRFDAADVCEGVTHEHSNQR